MTRRPFLALGAVLIIALAYALAASARHVGGPLERASLSERYVLRGHRHVSDKIVVVAIDAYSLRDLRTRFPVGRDRQAVAIRQLKRAGAAVIALDLTESGLTNATDDPLLVSALKRSHPTVVGVDTFSRSGRPDALAGQVEYADTNVLPGNVKHDPRGLGDWVTFTPPVGALRAFPAVAAAAYLNRGHLDVPPTALIDYPRTEPAFTRLHFSDVYHGKFDPAQVHGKVVVIGVTAGAAEDYHPVPGGHQLAGPEIQAASIATAIQGFPLRRVSDASARWTTFGLAVLVPLLLLGAGLRHPRSPLPRRLAPVAGGTALVAWLVAVQLLFDHGTAVAVVPGACALIAGTVLTWGAVVGFERRVYRELRRRFAAGEAEIIDRGRSAPPGTRDAELRLAIAGYELDLKTGRQGGQGIVYHATQQRLSRAVALKLMRQERSRRSKHRSDFLDEAKNAACVEHHHIVPIYDFGEDRGELYMVMRYVSGQSLGDAAMLSPDAVARVLHRVAGAVDTVHRAGLVHRDITPANVLLDGEDPEHPYLTDFGIARAAATRPRSAGFQGASKYASPEQIDGGSAITPRSDIYSLGGVMFFALTGRPPFTGTRPEMHAAHREAPRPLASKVNPALPSEIDAVIARAMAIDPDDRYETATELTLAALAILDRDEDAPLPSEAPPPQPPPAPGPDDTADPTETSTSLG